MLNNRGIPGIISYNTSEGVLHKLLNVFDSLLSQFVFFNTISRLPHKGTMGSPNLSLIGKWKMYYIYVLRYNYMSTYINIYAHLKPMPL